MKLLRDVVKSRPSTGAWVIHTPVPWGDEYEEERDSTHGYYGEPWGEAECCDWNYSQHAFNLGLIRHHGYCNNFNPQGLNEF